MAVIETSPVSRTLAYNELTTNVSVTATSEATANTIVTASAITVDGKTPITITAFTPVTSVGAGSTLTVCLYDGSSSIGFLGYFNPSGVVFYLPQSFLRRFTPSAGTHTYSIRAFIDGGTGTIGGGSGGAGANVPAFIKIEM